MVDANYSHSGKDNISSLNHLQTSSFPILSQAERTELQAWGITTPILSFFGAFNNILVLMVTYPQSGAKSGLNLLIFHFVAVNLWMCMVNVPVSVFFILAKRDGYFIPPNLCSYFQAIYGLGATLVNWTDSALAVNRCIALFLPHQYKSLTKNWLVGIMLMFIWLISLSGMLPMGFGVGGRLGLSPLG